MGFQIQEPYKSGRMGDTWTEAGVIIFNTKLSKDYNSTKDFKKDPNYIKMNTVREAAMKKLGDLVDDSYNCIVIESSEKPSGAEAHLCLRIGARGEERDFKALSEKLHEAVKILSQKEVEQKEKKETKKLQ